MSKKVKQFEIDTLRAQFRGVKDYVLIEPLKVDAATDYDFRRHLRAKKVRVQMVKNSYAKKVFGENGITLDGQWGGPTLLCWGATNAKSLGTAVDDQLKASKKDPKAPDKYKVKTGVLDGQPVALDVLKTAPTREEAVAEVLGMVVGVGASLAACLSGPGGQIASILMAIEEREEKAAAPAEAAAPAAAG